MQWVEQILSSSYGGIVQSATLPKNNNSKNNSKNKNRTFYVGAAPIKDEYPQELHPNPSLQDLRFAAGEQLEPKQILGKCKYGASKLTFAHLKQLYHFYNSMERKWSLLIEKFRVIQNVLKQKGITSAKQSY
jgi:hypothetical protein